MSHFFHSTFYTHIPIVVYVTHIYNFISDNIFAPAAIVVMFVV